MKLIKDTTFNACENTTLGVVLSQKTIKKLDSLTESSLDFSGKYWGEGIDDGQAHLHCQYPNGPDAQIYICGMGEEEFDKIKFKNDEVKEEFFEIVYAAISEAGENIDDFQVNCEILFGTSNIKKHDPLVEHGYYNDMHLVLLENVDEDRFYVTFTTNPAGTKLLERYKTFDALEDAKNYIKTYKNDDETWQDFSISHRIYKELKK